MKKKRHGSNVNPFLLSWNCLLVCPKENYTNGENSQSFFWGGGAKCCFLDLVTKKLGKEAILQTIHLPVFPNGTVGYKWWLRWHDDQVGGLGWWFGIRIGVPLSNKPFHFRGIPGIQTTGPQTTNPNHWLKLVVYELFVGLCNQFGEVNTP